MNRSDLLPALKQTSHYSCMGLITIGLLRHTSEEPVTGTQIPKIDAWANSKKSNILKASPVIYNQDDRYVVGSEV